MTRDVKQEAGICDTTVKGEGQRIPHRSPLRDGLRAIPNLRTLLAEPNKYLTQSQGRGNVGNGGAVRTNVGALILATSEP